jgi:predicted CoA-binding protein
MIIILLNFNYMIRHVKFQEVLGLGSNNKIYSIRQNVELVEMFKECHHAKKLKQG